MKKNIFFLVSILFLTLCSSCDKREEIESPDTVINVETRWHDDIVWTPELWSVRYDYYARHFVLCVNYSRHYLGGIQMQMRRGGDGGIWHDVESGISGPFENVNDVCRECRDERAYAYMFVPYNSIHSTDWYEFRWKSGLNDYFGVYYGRDWSNAQKVTVTNPDYAPRNHNQLAIVAKAKTRSSTPIYITVHSIDSITFSIPAGEIEGYCYIPKRDSDLLHISIYLGTQYIRSYSCSYDASDSILILDGI